MQVIACSLGMKPPQRKVAKKQNADDLLYMFGNNVVKDNSEFNKIDDLFKRAKKLDDK